MSKSHSARRSSQRGQGMTEYIIITALIAIGAIGAFVAFGDVVRGQVGGMAEELAGQQGTTEQTVQGAGQAAGGAGNTHIELGDYQTQNAAGQ